MNDHVVVAAVADTGPAVLSEFLACIAGLDGGHAQVSYLLLDPGTDERSSKLLYEFQATKQCHVETFPGRLPNGNAPGSDRLLNPNQALLEHAMAMAPSHVLFVQANLLLPPPLLAHLLFVRTDIVAEVFWTEWEAGGRSLPSVWCCDQYSLFPPDYSAAPATEQAAAVERFLSMLACPGTYQVGGVGGCTLVSRTALDAGVNFAPLHNSSLQGQDRHFSIRAAALGFELWADTHLAPLHLYRMDDLGKCDHFWARWAPAGLTSSPLTPI